MICYRDMTFCGFRECAEFGPCFRSLTDEVQERADKLSLPICQWVFDGDAKPECFVDKAA